MTTIISIPEGQYYRPAVRYDDGRVEPYAVSSATSGDVLFESPEQAIRYAQNAARSAADTMTVMRYGFGISGIVVLGLGLLDMLGIHATDARCACPGILCRHLPDLVRWRLLLRLRAHVLLQPSMTGGVTTTRDRPAVTI